MKEKPVVKPTEKVDAIKSEPQVNRNLDLEEVKKVWKEFAEQRKNQIAHYSMLSRDFELRGNQIMLQLTNPVEEPLLQSIKSDLLAYLRDNLKHSLLQLDYTIAQFESKRVAYTNKEKFDALAEKNPILKKLQEKFGLDPDF